MSVVEMTVNGKSVSAEVEDRTLLVEMLREKLGLTGTHVGCDTSQCGACLVLVDGIAVKSCTMLAVQRRRRRASPPSRASPPDSKLHPMQQAFHEHHGLQCGFCTPGMIISAVDMVRRLGNRARRGDHPPRARGQPLPLHRLPEHRQGDRRRRRGDGAVRRRARCTRPATTARQTLAEAAALFAGPEARYLSGGQTLIPTMKQRLAAPSDLIDIAPLGRAEGHRRRRRRRHHRRRHDPRRGRRLRRRCGSAIPALAALAGTIGDPAVRHMGTIGGSLANNDPAADYPGRRPRPRRHRPHRPSARSPPSDFFTGLFATALEDGEIVTRVDFPVPAKAAYEKFRNPASRYAMAGVFVAVMKDGAIRVGVTGAGNSGVFRATGDRAGAGEVMVAGRHRRRDDRSGRHALRHPRLRRLPRQPRQGDGQAGGRALAALPG